MNTRPRDICTAAFHNDTARLRQLVVAAGVYTNRWHPPCHIDTSAVSRASIEADLLSDDNYHNDGGASSGQDSSNVPQLASENIEEEMAEVMSEEEMAALLAHPELLRVTRTYALESMAEDEAARNGKEEAASAAGVENENDAELLDEGEEEAAEADRQAQQRDFLIYRCLLAEQQHRQSVAQRLQQHGFVHAGTTPPVNMTAYGILFSCREKNISASFADAFSPLYNGHNPYGDGAAVVHNDSGLAASASRIPLQVRWQPSKRSRYAGTPLHWAVLARAHDTVKFLIEHGADPTAGLKLDASRDGAFGGETQQRNKDNNSSKSAAAATEVLSLLTPAAMAVANESLRTLQVLEGALAARALEQENRELFFTALEHRMQRRKERYVRRRQIAIARRALQAQAQREEEEERERVELETGGAEKDEDGEGKEHDGVDDEADDVEK